MKRVLIWSGVGVGAVVGTYYAIRGMRGTRWNVKDGLGRAERIADTARTVLDTAQKALHATRQSI